MIRNPLLPGSTTGSEARAINEQWDGVGVSGTVTSEARAVLWSGGVMTDIGETADFARTTALAIDSSGDIVGFGLAGRDEAAVRFAGGQVILLLAEVSNSRDWQLQSACSINTDGTMVGEGCFHGK